MKKLTKEQLQYLTLTKAMADYLESEENTVERWSCLDDVVREVLEDGRIDREDYWHRILELTQLGLVNSDITEEDKHLIEGMDFSITGLTPDGEKYIEQLNATFQKKVILCLGELMELLKKVNKSDVVQFTGTVVLPILSLLR